MNTRNQHWCPNGFFPLLVRIEMKRRGTESGLSEAGGLTPQNLLARFVKEAAITYDLLLPHEDAEPSRTAAQTSSGGSTAEMRIAVPFADRENIRISYNIFASTIDEECGDDGIFHFHMESDF